MLRVLQLWGAACFQHVESFRPPKGKAWRASWRSPAVRLPAGRQGILDSTKVESGLMRSR